LIQLRAFVETIIFLIGQTEFCSFVGVCFQHHPTDQNSIFMVVTMKNVFAFKGCDHSGMQRALCFFNLLP